MTEPTAETIQQQLEDLKDEFLAARGPKRTELTLKYMRLKELLDAAGGEVRVQRREGQDP